jgi:glycosyltransferase involved in cell wall biosynthesis
MSDPGEPTSQPPADRPRVSVIIPVFNDAARLKACLDRLARQTYPRDGFEVIVVDNGSSEPIEPVMRDRPGVRLVREDRPGSYIARNHGIAAATGEILAFTDSDCLPALDWIEQGVARLLREDNCGLVAGRVDVFARDPSDPTAVELHEQLTAFPQRRYVANDHYGATANVFTPRSVIDQVGGFNERLKSSGDNEWGNRIYSAGYKLVYADEARVAHPARRSIREVYRKVTRLTGGQRDWRTQPRFAWRDLFYDVRPPIGLMCRTLREPRLPGIARKLKFVAVEVFIRYTRAFERTRLYLSAESRR